MLIKRFQPKILSEVERKRNPRQRIPVTDSTPSLSLKTTMQCKIRALHMESENPQTKKTRCPGSEGGGLMLNFKPKNCCVRGKSQFPSGIIAQISDVARLVFSGNEEFIRRR